MALTKDSEPNSSLNFSHTLSFWDSHSSFSDSELKNHLEKRLCLSPDSIEIKSLRLRGWRLCHCTGQIRHELLKRGSMNIKKKELVFEKCASEQDIFALVLQTSERRVLVSTGHTWVSKNRVLDFFGALSIPVERVYTLYRREFAADGSEVGPNLKQYSVLLGTADSAKWLIQGQSFALKGASLDLQAQGFQTFDLLSERSAKRSASSSPSNHSIQTACKSYSYEKPKNVSFGKNGIETTTKKELLRNFLERPSRIAYHKSKARGRDLALSHRGSQIEFRFANPTTSAAIVIMGQSHPFKVVSII